MKLRNKKTGEIKEVEPITIGGFRSLAELNEEWEDYGEPKEWWFIDCTGFIKHGEGLFTEKSYIKDIQEIDNFFETKEEAEKVVEKLKAWKRLKDKGFRFDCWDNEDRATIHDFVIYCRIKDLDNINKDLDLLFGGEE